MRSVLLSIIGILMITSCEYEADNNYFHEVVPPTTSTLLEIKLNDIDSKDTIYIMKETRFSLNLNTYGKEVKELYFTLDGNRIYTDINSGFEIRPDKYEDGVYQLFLTGVFSSGTGSLADIMGMEGYTYTGEMSWNIRIMRNFNPELRLGYRKNTDNFLELYWETSHIPVVLFDSYEVSTNKRVIISDQNQKSIILEEYLFGYQSSSVTLYIKCADGYSYSYYQSATFSYPAPKLYFEVLNVNKLQVSWNRPFSDASYKLTCGYNGYATSDTSLIVSPPPFSSSFYYNLDIYPKSSEKSNRISEEYLTGKRGIYASDITYFNDKLYAINAGEIYTVDLQTLDEKHLIDLVEPGYETKISCAKGSRKIATKQDYSFFIYEHNQLLNPVVSYKSQYNWNTELFYLTDNNRLFIVESYATTCSVYNADNGSLLFTFNIARSDSRRISVSIDGRYLCYVDGKGLTIYTIGENNVEHIRTVPGVYTNVIFNPVNPEQLVVRKDNDIQILKMPDIQNIYSFSAPNSTLLDIDPANGNILYFQHYYQQDSLHVIRSNPSFTPVFAIATYRSYAKLKGNLLMDNSNGYYLDISQYLKP